MIPPKRNFQILFRDSSEYFYIVNARMFTEGPLVRFVLFNDQDEMLEDVYYPLCNVYRIKTYKITQS
jgi:hypothetical protein